MTLDGATLHAAARERLDALITVTVYDADVPAHPPADEQGRVYPYAVVWPSPGATPPEAAVDGSTGTDWVVAVTVAAGDVDWCLQTVTVVRRALTGDPIAPGATLVDTTPAARTLLVDRDVAPARFYVPLEFRALTP